MTFYVFSSRLAWPLVVWSLAAAPAVCAQTGTTAAPTAPIAPSGLAAAPPVFKSAFEGYLAYTNDETTDWRQANDNTARIGGWRAYAREAAEPDPHPNPSAAPLPATSAKTAAPVAPKTQP